MALALAAAFTAPYAAPLGCGGETCCDMQMAEQMHHGTDVAVSSIDASSQCPMVACGVASTALTIESGAVVPDGIIGDVSAGLSASSYASATLPPSTPPPRA